MTVIAVTGTDTGVGKTVATAALATAFAAGHRSVAVFKPVQAGTEDGDGDVDVVRRLTGIDDVHEGIRLRDPMAPVAAAARSGVRLPPLSSHCATIRRLAAHHDIVLVEGAGGLLVALDEEGHTIADLAGATSAGVVVVCRSGLGTLNHTALTLEALRHRGSVVAGLVIGAWPRRPDLVDRANRQHLAGLAEPILGAVPDGAGRLSRSRFRRLAPRWFTPSARVLGTPTSTLGTT